jgi:HlyD family secretion protein
MTAQVRLVVANRPNVLRIPTTALRFQLPEEEQEKLRKKEQEKAKGDKDAGVRQAALKPVSTPDDDVAFRTASETARMFKVYRLDKMNQPQPVDIRVGLSNFRYTEVLSGELKAGDQVVTRTLANPKEEM